MSPLGATTQVLQVLVHMDNLTSPLDLTVCVLRNATFADLILANGSGRKPAAYSGCFSTRACISIMKHFFHFGTSNAANKLAALAQPLITLCSVNSPTITLNLSSVHSYHFRQVLTRMFEEPNQVLTHYILKMDPFKTKYMYSQFLVHRISWFNANAFQGRINLPFIKSILLHTYYNLNTFLFKCAGPDRHLTLICVTNRIQLGQLDRGH